MRTATRWMASAVVTGLLSGGWAQGGLIVTDSFNYGASNFAISAATSTMAGGTGFKAGTSWHLGMTGGSAPNDRGAYLATGLSFGQLITSGGCIESQGQWSGSSFIARQIDGGPSTIYGSFLFKLGGAKFEATDDAGLQIADTSGRTQWGSDALLFPAGWNTTSSMIQMQSGATLSGTAPAYDGATTYLMLFKIAGLGQNPAPTTISAWVLTLDQLANFKPLYTSALSESALNGASLGTGVTGVLERGTVTQNPGYSLLTDRYLIFTAWKGIASSSIFPVQFDELRIGNASLDETVPLVPEPTAGALLLAGLALALRRRRRC